VWHPDRLNSVYMWVGSPAELEEVGVWVICCGVQGDAPMRQMLIKGLGISAERGCDQCGILAKKGAWNASKYTGYIRPCDVDLRDTDGKFWAQALGWASGKVKHGSSKRPMPDSKLIDNHLLTERQVTGRDIAVDTGIQNIKNSHRQNPTAAESAIERLVMKEGSRGRSEFGKSGLPYWQDSTSHPVAVYHTTVLGPVKDLTRWFLARMGTADKTGLVLPLRFPKITKAIMHARLKHFVYRNKPDCIIPDFTAVLGHMSMSEMQLFFEVGVPYLVHDLTAFGAHPAVALMFLLLRHAVLCFTRLMCNSREEYGQQLLCGQACVFAYAAIAEYFHSKDDNGMSQFSFTWKLHKLQHIPEQLWFRGFTTESSDAWVERLMRHKASMILKCDTHTLIRCSCCNCSGRETKRRATYI
jgi:hypothetical protein